MTATQPPAVPGSLIVAVVEAIQRNWPDRPPPIFRAADVLPLLAGGDREYAAASTLLDVNRVHYPEGKP